jgi:hypothetical protein
MWYFWKKLFGSNLKKDLRRSSNQNENNKTGTDEIDSQTSKAVTDRRDADRILRQLQDPEMSAEQIPDDETFEHWLGGRKLSDAQRELLERTRLAANNREKKGKHSLEPCKEGQPTESEELIDGRLATPEPSRTEEERKQLKKNSEERGRRANEFERQLELRERLGRGRDRGGMGL